MTELTDARALVVPLNVVAAKKPGQWIVRAFSPYTDMSILVRCVRAFVGTMDPEVEWTGHRYEGFPSYVIYGEGDLERIAWPSGVYRFDHKGGEVYGPAHRLGDVK